MKSRVLFPHLLAPLLLSGMLLPSACGDDTIPQPHETYLTVQIGEAFEAPEDLRAYSIEIEDDFVLALDEEWPDKYIGIHVGTARLYRRDQHNYGCTVEVLPKNTRFIEPYMGWDESQEDIERRFGIPDMTDYMRGVFSYIMPNNAQIYNSYLFELNNLVGVVMTVSPTAKRTLDEFLAERYMMGEEIETGVRPFARYSGKMPFKRPNLVGQIATTDQYIHVLYAPSPYYLDKALEAIDDIEF